MIDPEAAWEALLPHLRALPAERIERSAAAGRTLAAPLLATTDLPPCDLSALDGFALAGEAGAERGYPVAGTRFAGDSLENVLSPLAPGSAMRIMTGAAIPAGADRVVGVEETACEGGWMRTTVAVPPGAAIRRQGEVVRRGAALLPAGTLLTPAALALLASQGIGEVTIHRPPRLALQLTGNEIVPPDETPGPGQLRDSHSDFLLAELARLGLPVRSLGIARDEPEALAASLERGLVGTDVLLCCGGVSMGEADFLVPVLARFGCETLFHGVAIQPGKPLLVARRSHTEGVQLIFGLPGNPASVMVAWWLFVRPALARLMGSAAGFWTTALPGKLTAPLGGGKRRDRFVPATWRLDAGRPLLTPISPQGSHDLLAFGQATALLRVRAGAAATPAGADCEWLPLDG
ncbi:MAG: molybdopterin molybdotransferase MoeA [Thermoanaerobaculia bacterium]